MAWAVFWYQLLNLAFTLESAEVTNVAKTLMC